MSLSIYFHGAEDGNDGPFSLASASGWKAFADWAESLPDGFVSVKTLAEEGEVKDTATLAEQLELALTVKPPLLAVADTARGLLDNLGVGDASEIATVLSEDE